MDATWRSGPVAGARQSIWQNGGHVTVGQNGAAGMLRRRHERGARATSVLPLQQLPNHLQGGGAGIASPGEEGEQAPLADHWWKVAQLACAPRGYRTRLDLGGQPLLLERPADRLFCDAGIHALGAQVFHEPRRPAPARGPHSGVLLREAPVIDQATRFQPPQRPFHSLSRVLLLAHFSTPIKPPRWP